MIVIVVCCVCVCVCDASMRRQYVPLTLLSLQRMVDLGRIDVMQPIDLTAMCNTKVVIVDPAKKHYGINLTDEVRIP